MLLCKYKTNKQNTKQTNPCPRCHGLAPPGPVLATKKSKKLQRKRRRTHLLLVSIIFVGSFSIPSSVLRITEMVVDFNSRIPTYLAKIFLGNELSISCQKLWQLNTIHYSSSSSAFAWQSRTPSSLPSLARRPRRPQRPRRPRMPWSRLGGNLSYLLNLNLWRNPVMNDTNPMDN